jgi:hypothetical protein
LSHSTIGGQTLQRSVCRFFQFTLEVSIIEVRINKEVRDYQESLFFGLSLRQFLFALLAVLVAVGLYFGLRNVVGSGEIGWICVLAAFPFALGGFFTYNGMTFEKFLLAVIRSELLYPRKLVFRAENLYAKALEHSSVKEALKID